MNVAAIEHDFFAYLSPDSFIGATAYLVLFVLLALLLSRALRAAVHAALTRKGSFDRTTISFLQQIITALIWVSLLILYAHLIPVLRSMGTALLAGASVASVVIGLAAQSTLGNLVAGVSITIYRPFRLGDILQIAAPTGTETGVVELISLGYTTLRAIDGHLIVVPNSLAASQVTINLNASHPPSAIAISISVNRDPDWESTPARVRDVAATLVDEKAMTCRLVKVEPTAATYELRVKPADDQVPEGLRGELLTRLAVRFTAASLS